MGVILRFESSLQKDTILDCQASDNWIYFTIIDVSDPNDKGRTIPLDIPTSVKLHKTLRQEIAKAKQAEGGYYED